MPGRDRRDEMHLCVADRVVDQRCIGAAKCAFEVREVRVDCETGREISGHIVLLCDVVGVEFT